MKHMVRQHGVIVSTTYSKHAGLAHLVCFVVFIVLLMALPPVARTIEIDPELEEKFEADRATGYAIYFRAKANLSEAQNGVERTKRVHQQGASGYRK